MTIALTVFAVPTLILAVILTALIEPLIHPRPARSNTMEHLEAPWTEQQVAALNAFQRSGRGLVFTCDQHPMKQTLIAELDGWHCPDESCGHHETWAYPWMADRRLAAMVYAQEPPPRPPQTGLAAELRRVRAELRATQQDLGEERRRNADLAGRNAELTERLAELQHGNALHIHEAMRRVAAVDVPCGELLRDQKIEDVLTTQELL